MSDTTEDSSAVLLDGDIAHSGTWPPQGPVICTIPVVLDGIEVSIAATLADSADLALGRVTWLRVANPGGADE